MENFYNIILYLNNGDGKTEAIKGTVEFDHDPEQYGNGYGMFIKAPTELFGGQGYDIRYDTSFDPENKIAYLVTYFSNRFSGKGKGVWKLIGIRVHEAENDQ